METIYVILGSAIASLSTILAIIICPCSRRRKTIVFITTLFMALIPLSLVRHTAYSFSMQYNGMYIGVKNIVCSKMLGYTIYCVVQGTGDPVVVNQWLLFAYLYIIIYVVLVTTILFLYMLNEIIHRRCI